MREKSSWKVRPSRVVMSYGPGSICDFPERESFMVMGTDVWPAHRRIQEPRLAAKWGVDHFGEPDVKRTGRDEDDVVGLPVRDFPRLRLCPTCKRLTPQIHCRVCKPRPPSREGPKTLPVRLVAACVAGHIEDFPWARWIGCRCETPELFLDGERAESENSRPDR